MSEQFTAKTLEEAYEKATAALECSITDLEIDIIQQSSSGFLGFFSKDAIIEVSIQNKKNKSFKKSVTKSVKPKTIPKNTIKNKPRNNHKTTIPQVQSQKIFDDFYDSKDTKKVNNNIVIKQDSNTIIEEIQLKINDLFNSTCYKLDTINVDFYDAETIYIEFKGEDAALLIGKEGYRYKSLSYILFNWIHEKYNLMVRLEVAEFLVTQEEAINNYLIPVIQTIKEDGFYKTKPLDGILVHIALKRLREEFPNKYVAVKTNIKGDKYILVNEYKKQQ